MRVLVTGGLGFTGVATVSRLLKDGHTVVVLDKQPGLACEQLKEAGAEVTLGSVTDGDLVARMVVGAEVVLHLAAAFREVGVSDSVYREVNVEGTRLVAHAARHAGVRKLVYCSTQGVHGHIGDPPGDESSPICPEDCYQETKYQGELAVREVCGDKLEFTILRPTAIYGPGDPARFLMIFQRVQKGTFPMFGDGQAYYHPVYIDNLVDAFVLVMAAGVGAGEAYIIADQKYVTIRHLVERVARAMGQQVHIPTLPLRPLIIAGHLCDWICKPFGIEPLIFPRRVDWFRQVRAFRIERARIELGYEPQVDLDEGLRRTAEWYREHGFLEA